jgi:hypothetical protein
VSVGGITVSETAPFRPGLFLVAGLSHLSHAPNQSLRCSAHALTHTHTTPDGRREYMGMEATFELLKARISDLRIDGLMGFSLGAAVVAAFVARCAVALLS